MGEADMYEYWKDTYKIQTQDWTQQRAKEILTEWQKKFNDKVVELVAQKGYDRKFDINSFSASHMETILDDFSKFNHSRMAVGCFIMVIRY